MIFEQGWTLFREGGDEVSKGESVTSFDGEEFTLVGAQPPAHAGSTGRVYVEDADQRSLELFPEVVGLKWRTSSKEAICLSQ